jgi:hypothetical protein
VGAREAVAQIERDDHTLSDVAPRMTKHIPARHRAEHIFRQGRGGQYSSQNSALQRLESW